MMNSVKIAGIYSGIIGALYLIYGILELVLWFYVPFTNPFMPAGDIMGGFILLLIGSLYIYRIKALLDMRYEGLSFLFVGLVLSAIIGIMYILIMGADALDALVNGEPWEFDAGAYNLPAIILFLLSLPCWLVMKERENFRE
jgi:hypothetical protein